MKKSFLSIFALFLFSCTGVQATSFEQVNIWTNYTGVEFEDLSQDQKTAKFQKVFEDLIKFTKCHKSRRVLIRALDPASFAFFAPQNFNSERDDNFFYWAAKLKKHAEIEVVFDLTSFRLDGYPWKAWLLDQATDFFKVKRPLGAFQNMREKLAWISILNEMFDPYFRLGTLIRGITVNLSGLPEETSQLVINTLDLYRSNALPELSPNRFYDIRIGVCISLDQKNLALANLSHFPLLTDIRGEKPSDIGITVPENFPALGSDYLAPEWRVENNRPLLDTIYINMGDIRLVDAIYQNHALLPDPIQENSKGSCLLAEDLGKNLRNEPFVKGPGFITNPQGSNTIAGLYTFFKTGGGKKKQGQFISGGKIEIRPPFVEKAITKVISDDPVNNKNMRITSPFSTTKDLTGAEYYLTATPVRWDYPKISNALLSKIYFVFSTEFEPANQRRFLGNWHVKNFLNFLNAFLNQKVFTNFNGEKVKPVKNLVLYDFTTLPNGNPYPECDWELGNQNHN